MPQVQPAEHDVSPIEPPEGCCGSRLDSARLVEVAMLPASADPSTFEDLWDGKRKGSGSGSGSGRGSVVAASQTLFRTVRHQGSKGSAFALKTICYCYRLSMTTYGGTLDCSDGLRWPCHFTKYKLSAAAANDNQRENDAKKKRRLGIRVSKHDLRLEEFFGLA
ncbi:uncharacterized protein MYCFIDRAFT_200827 [Pseudocercospora fijiensis CIRAD86]|uniref:Uncharacterized protein n=1 Tax=Pseudocercospora fijiensis (strain CIRAD86) TaxID=383855 RepID=M2ZD52_PSEFD|nr:uncharacterized protein MYCFIDRAFT_200827 [Pseudocercospora fijiensis CIRAD86]EME77054.1 hypothetical protein MYCFIDRAFT_200827 [Pseudocercospora fijiensis CIRAD86]